MINPSSLIPLALSLSLALALSSLNFDKYEVADDTRTPAPLHQISSTHLGRVLPSDTGLKTYFSDFLRYRTEEDDFFSFLDRLHYFEQLIEEKKV